MSVKTFEIKYAIHEKTQHILDVDLNILRVLHKILLYSISKYLLK